MHSIAKIVDANKDGMYSRDKILHIFNKNEIIELFESKRKQMELEIKAIEDSQSQHKKTKQDSHSKPDEEENENDCNNSSEKENSDDLIRKVKKKYKFYKAKHLEAACKMNQDIVEKGIDADDSDGDMVEK